MKSESSLKTIFIILLFICLILSVVLNCLFLLKIPNTTEFFVRIYDSTVSGEAVVIIFLILFRKEIAALISKIKNLKVFGSEIDINSERQDDEGIKKVEEVVEDGNSTNANRAALNNYLNLLQQQEMERTQQVESLQSQLREAQIKALGFEFAYLSGYFVLNTKRALAYINKNEGILKELFLKDFNVPNEIPNRDSELLTILSVLNRAELIKINPNNTLETTEKGRLFLSFISKYESLE